MKITLKDGSVKEYDKAMSVYEIAQDLSEGLARVACAGEVDGEVVDLRTVLDKDCNLSILTAADPEGLRVIRHTCSHVTRLKNTINGGQRLSLQLADENNSVFQAYLRELDTRIAPGVLLSDAQITTQNKGGVVLYILESYQIVGSPEENAA